MADISITEEDGLRTVLIEPVNHGLVKAFRRCPRQTMYKYVDQILPIVYSKPLTRGTWFHALLEAHYNGGDWKAVHQAHTKRFQVLSDQDKDDLGDLPRELLRMMRCYLWHYKYESEWKVLAVEKTLSATLPNGRKFRCKLDMIIRDDFGLWIVDHKTHSRIPGLNQRLLDTQSPAYIWACWENGIDVDGFIWNYIKTKTPAVPKILKSGDRFSKKMGETDYYTFAVALKQAGFDPEDYRGTLDMLKRQQYKYGEPQTSPFFLRHIIHANEDGVGQAVRELMTTQERFEEYNFDPRTTERVVDRSCDFMCSYQDLCIAQLHGHRTDHIMRNYRHGDPFEYYEDAERNR